MAAGDAEVESGRVRMCGLVLCGGRSTRMGVDKATLLLQGERLVDRAVRRLAAVADPVLLAGGDTARAVAGCTAVADARSDAGPLGGLVAGLRASPHPLCAVVAVDMPYFDDELLALLAGEIGSADAAVPAGSGGLEPLHAVYHRRALPVLEAALAAAALRLQAVLEQLRIERVDVAERLGEDRAQRFAVNLNRPEDLAAARRSGDAGWPSRPRRGRPPR